MRVAEDELQRANDNYLLFHGFCTNEKAYQYFLVCLAQHDKALLGRVRTEVIEPDFIPYHKLQRCPSCNAPHSYQCTCSDAEYFVKDKQLVALNALLPSGGVEGETE